MEGVDPTLALLFSCLAVVILAAAGAALVGAIIAFQRANVACDRADHDRFVAQDTFEEARKIQNVAQMEHEQADAALREAKEVRQAAERDWHEAKDALEQAQETLSRVERAKQEESEIMRQARVDLERADQQCELARKMRIEAEEIRLESACILLQAQKERELALEDQTVTQSELKRAWEERQQAALQLEQAELKFQTAVVFKQQAEHKTQESEQLVCQAKEMQSQALADRALSDLIRMESDRARGAAEEREREADKKRAGIEAELARTVDDLQLVRGNYENALQALWTAEKELDLTRKDRDQADTKNRELCAELELATENLKKEQEKCEKAENDLKRLLQQQEQLLSSAASLDPMASPSPEYGAGTEKSHLQLPINSTKRRFAEVEEAQEESGHKTDTGGGPSAKRTIGREKGDQASEKPLESRPGERTLPGFEERPSFRDTNRKKPEIICGKRDRSWVPGISIPDDLDDDVVSLTQGGRQLDREHTGDSTWLLRDIDQHVTICWGDKERRMVDLNGPILLFKLIGESQQEGRHICLARGGYISPGTYLALVPTSWRPEESSDLVPEPVSLDGVDAYVFAFDRDRETQQTFLGSDGRPVTFQSGGPHLELIGYDLHDVTHGIGPLFTEPPRIKATAEVWKEIQTVVVGEEGRGKGKWRLAFEPDPIDGIVALPEQEFANPKGGWYFVRFYNIRDQLIESLDFRFARGLDCITVEEQAPFPFGEGHRAAHIEFHHDASLAVRPASEQESRLCTVRDDTVTMVEVPPDSRYDKCCWLIVTKDAESHPLALVTTRVERVWWTISMEGSTVPEWTDRCLTLSRSDFAATSMRALWLKFPQQRWTDCVYVNLGSQCPRPYRVSVREESLFVPLRDFGDSLEQCGLGVVQLKVQMSSRHGQLGSGVAQLRMEACCKNCDFASMVEQEMLDHIAARHLGDCFRPLTYPEHRGMNPSLPDRIVMCPHGDFVAYSGNGKRPVDEIEDHIKKYRHFVKGYKQYREISDVEEIRKILPHLVLPQISKCLVGGCDWNDENGTATSKMAHLLEKHKQELYRIR